MDIFAGISGDVVPPPCVFSNHPSWSLSGKTFTSILQKLHDGSSCWPRLVVDNPLAEQLGVPLGWVSRMAFLTQPGDKGGERVVMPADGLRRSSLRLMRIEIRRNKVLGLNDNSS